MTHGNPPNIQYINAAAAAASGRVYVSFGRRDLNKPNIIQQELTTIRPIPATAPPRCRGR